MLDQSTTEQLEKLMLFELDRETTTKITFDVTDINEEAHTGDCTEDKCGYNGKDGDTCDDVDAHHVTGTLKIVSPEFSMEGEITVSVDEIEPTDGGYDASIVDSLTEEFQEELKKNVVKYSDTFKERPQKGKIRQLAELQTKMQKLLEDPDVKKHLKK